MAGFGRVLPVAPPPQVPITARSPTPILELFDPRSFVSAAAPSGIESAELLPVYHKKLSGLPHE